MPIDARKNAYINIVRVSPCIWSHNTGKRNRYPYIHYPYKYISIRFSIYGKKENEEFWKWLWNIIIIWKLGHEVYCVNLNGKYAITPANESQTLNGPYVCTNYVTFIQIPVDSPHGIQCIYIIHAYFEKNMQSN